MNSIHDMGGMHGHGPIEIDPDAPVFYAPWEARVMALFDAMSPWSSWSGDRFRYARETISPADNLTQSYYAQWLWCFIQLFLEDGLISEAELAAGRSDPGQPARQPKIRPEDIDRIIAGEDTARRESGAPARFAVGEFVVAINGCGSGMENRSH